MTIVIHSVQVKKRHHRPPSLAGGVRKVNLRCVDRSETIPRISSKAMGLNPEMTWYGCLLGLHYHSSCGRVVPRVRGKDELAGPHIPERALHVTDDGALLGQRLGVHPLVGSEEAPDQREGEAQGAPGRLAEDVEVDRSSVEQDGRHAEADQSGGVGQDFGKHVSTSSWNNSTLHGISPNRNRNLGNSSGIPWAVGITTVPARLVTTLPKTLESLERAGFPDPRLFVDGISGPIPHPILKYEMSVRSSKIGAFGNWLLALQELLIRYPVAERYALFQDDIIAPINLRHYLDRCQYRDNTYWNLTTYPAVAEMVHPGRGWCVSPQKGKGAQGLVFSRDVACAILGSRQFVDRVTNVERNKHGHAKGTVNIDGGVVEAAKALGIRELVHMPSLLWHDHGEPSAIGHLDGFNPRKQQPEIRGWVGENFDCLSLLELPVPHTHSPDQEEARL